MPSILIVCTGNQCRSPMAEGLMRTALAAAGKGDWVVGSAGTWTRDGVPATAEAVQAVAERGVDISRHRSRQVNAKILEQADLILVLTSAHAEAIRAEFTGLRAPIWLMSELGGARYDIPDPIGQPLEEYRATANELARLVEGGVGRMIRVLEEQPQA